MTNYRIPRVELAQAQLALFAAIGLQIAARYLGNDFVPGSQYFIILAEILLVVVLGFTTNMRLARSRGVHGALAIILLALISFTNISGLAFVLHSLIVGHGSIDGTQLLAVAIAIFLTNIIVYALWYWEIDSPGLTRKTWSKNDKDFQFTQQDMSQEFPQWRPQFGDYLYLSVTNAVNFAPADTRPITRQAKTLMASQALVSVFTLALVIARSVSILGA